MKKITFFFATLSMLYLVSCSSNDAEVLPNNENAESKLQSYTLKRNTDGTYYIDFNVAENTEINTYKNPDNSNEVVISESNGQTANKQSTNFVLENDFLKVNILESNNGKKTRIAVEDENSSTFANKGITEFLNNYSVTKNTDGTFTLDFEVNNNVQTEFIYNKVEGVYEVHLKNGDAKTKNFSRVLEINDNDALKIDFVNYKNLGRSEETYTVDKPKVVILSLSDEG
ncbi:hypothetical protein ACQY1Q_11400 [Tenacibaculum sp. TC6]|uniref:hypothetical protein n=1 Tax=Tenacibaculum sp. TC6 TaxID=3423223 RepID=UPI003D3649B6